jgi:hypothetical protein
MPVYERFFEKYINGMCRKNQAFLPLFKPDKHLASTVQKATKD